MIILLFEILFLYLQSKSWIRSSSAGAEPIEDAYSVLSSLLFEAVAISASRFR